MHIQQHHYQFWSNREAPLAAEYEAVLQLADTRDNMLPAESGWAHLLVPRAERCDAYVLRGPIPRGTAEHVLAGDMV